MGDVTYPEGEVLGGVVCHWCEAVLHITGAKHYPCMVVLRILDVSSFYVNGVWWCCVSLVWVVLRITRIEILFVVYSESTTAKIIRQISLKS